MKRPSPKCGLAQEVPQPGRFFDGTHSDLFLLHPPQKPWDLSVKADFASIIHVRILAMFDDSGSAPMRRAPNDHHVTVIQNSSVSLKLCCVRSNGAGSVIA